MHGASSELNPAQLKAVEHDPDIPLQILAGPGSGKTKVLISRIARLTTVHKIAPSSICAVTFTNKAANEMRDRLTKLIGKTQTSQLKMGTFHSICARYLRMYPAAVNLDANFTICDADESKKLISALMKPYAEYMAHYDIILSDGTAASIISKAKAKGQSGSIFFQEMERNDRLSVKKHPAPQPGMEEKKSIQRIVAEVYIGYEQILKTNNALDFDDLLIYGVKLFSGHQESVIWCRHILVDEFQDTNTMQYELMKAIAFRRSVTIVGDPDQSIYGWRSAEVVNLARMRQDFGNTEQILLEQNYRSTASILRACLAIVSEDKKRIPKSLHTSHPLGATPFIGRFESEKEEAGFIAQEIKRCVANMGGTLNWGDFVILLRFNALSRPIESALQREGIPCRILGGHKFFERMEVKDVLSYLQLANNPSFNPAFIRAVKVPARGMGDKSLSELASKAQELKMSQLELVERIHNNKVADIKPPIKKKIISFVKAIRCLRKFDQEGRPPSEMIRKLIDMIQYEDHLKKTQQDWDSRWENVQELITFACEIEADSSRINGQETQAEQKLEQTSVLRDFLQASVLSSEGDNDGEEQSKEKVTLSTCHAAKGLEWPVVMVPAVDQDTFPFYRTEDIDEERRLLYVACTRAQTLLYVLHADKRVVAGKTKVKKLSEFIETVRKKDEGLFSYDVPRFLPEDRSVISTILGRPVPDETEIQRRLDALTLAGDHVQPTYQTAQGEMSTVSLTGIRSNMNEAPIDQVNLASMYAAPDALAAISATFMRDHRRAPFSKTAKPVSTSNSYSTSFTPSSGVLMNSMQSGLTAYSSNADLKSGRLYPPQIAESSRQGLNRDQLSNHHRQPVRQMQTLHQNGLPSTISRVSASKIFRVDEPSSINAPLPPKPVQNPSFAAVNVASSSTVPNARSRHADKISNASRHQSESRDASQPNENSHHISARVLEKQAVKGSTATPQVFKDCNDSTTRGLAGSNSVGSASILAKSIIMDRVPALNELSDHNMVGLAASEVVSTRPKDPLISRNLGAVSNLPTLTKSAPNTDPSRTPNTNGSQPAPSQSIGVKRRLGMGRSTIGYSNKKFKHPV